MRSFAYAAVSTLASAIALILTFTIAFWVQIAIFGERGYENDAGPQFGLVASSAFFGILVAIATFAWVFRRLHKWESSTPKVKA